MDASVTPVSPSHSNSDGGGWSSVVQNKKGKGKKKKLKNARTLSLQTFFSEHTGNSENEHMSNELSSVAENSLPELSSEDRVVRESLFSYFSDVLRRVGPVRVSGPELQAELDHLSDEGKELIGRHSDIVSFIGQSGQLVLVDDLVCVKEDEDRARKMAVEVIVANVSNRSKPTPAGAASNAAQGQTAAVPPATVWNSQNPLTATIKANAAAGSSADTSETVDPWLQLPKVDSLFNYDNSTSTSGSNLLTSFAGLSTHMKPPDLSGPPPTIQRPATSSSTLTNGFTSTSVGSSRFGVLGSSVGGYDNGPASSTSQTNLENLNRRLQLQNSELLSQLDNKERQLQHFSKLLAPHEELVTTNDKLKLELDEAKKEINRLRGLLDNRKDTDDKNKLLNDKQTSSSGIVSDLLSLQRQLETERLNSLTLKHQLEQERAYSTKLNEKHNYLMNRIHSSAPGSGGGSPSLVGGGLGLSGDSLASIARQQQPSSSDSFGLRGLLANTSSVFRGGGGGDDSTSGVNSSSSLLFSGVAPSSSMSGFPGSASSSVSSAMLSKPSSPFSISASPPLQLNSFSNSFGNTSGTDFSPFEHQRRLTGSTSRLGLSSTQNYSASSLSSTVGNKP